MAESTAYCVTCKTDKPVANVRLMRLVNRRLVERGECRECGTRTSRFVKEKA